MRRDFFRTEIKTGTCSASGITSPVLGALVQAGRGIPFLLLPETDLQFPAPVHCRASGTLRKWTGCQQSQNQSALSSFNPPSGDLAVKSQLAIPRLPVGVELDHHRTIHGLSLEPGSSSNQSARPVGNSSIWVN
jgi:hypothetical protein